MSNLKHLSHKELIQARKDCLKYINHLERKLRYAKTMLSGQREKLKWIDEYLSKKEHDEKCYACKTQRHTCPKGFDN